MEKLISFIHSLSETRHENIFKLLSIIEGLLIINKWQRTDIFLSSHPNQRMQRLIIGAAGVKHRVCRGLMCFLQTHKQKTEALCACFCAERKKAQLMRVKNKKTG